MVPVVSFVGYHNSGKTTFATKVLKILKEKGYRIAAIKATKHSKVVKDVKGKDSYKYREAGAESVGIFTPDELILFHSANRETLNPELLSFLLFEEFDLVLCEGFKSSPVPKIEVWRKEVGGAPLYRKLENVVAVVSDVNFQDVKTFSLNDYEEVARFIEEEFIKKRRSELEIFVNGRRFPLEETVKERLKKIIFETLKETGRQGEIHLKIRPAYR